MKMNERIKELAEQAGYSKDYLEIGLPSNMEKFAELIVEECAKIAALTPCPYEDEQQRRTFGHTWDMACVESARDIKKHFGVKQ